MAKLQLDFKEMERTLRDADPKIVYIFRELYEIVNEQGKALDQQSSILLAFAEQLQGFVQLSEATNSRLANLTRKVSGVEVQSVPWDKDPELKQ